MVVCHALMMVCIHTHTQTDQDSSAAIRIGRKEFMNAQEDTGGCWFCALKMHYLTKILQSRKSHLFTLQMSKLLCQLYFLTQKLIQRPKEV